jgi:hypothetical protein
MSPINLLHIAHDVISGRFAPSRTASFVHNIPPVAAALKCFQWFTSLHRSTRLDHHRCRFPRHDATMQPVALVDRQRDSTPEDISSAPVQGEQLSTALTHQLSLNQLPLATDLGELHQPLRSRHYAFP